MQAYSSRPLIVSEIDKKCVRFRFHMLCPIGFHDLPEFVLMMRNDPHIHWTGVAVNNVLLASLNLVPPQDI
jgi:hypothetical protein